MRELGGGRSAHAPVRGRLRRQQFRSGLAAAGLAAALAAACASVGAGARAQTAPAESSPATRGDTEYAQLTEAVSQLLDETGREAFQVADDLCARMPNGLRRAVTRDPGPLQRAFSTLWQHADAAQATSPLFVSWLQRFEAETWLQFGNHACALRALEELDAGAIASAAPGLAIDISKSALLKATLQLHTGDASAASKTVHTILNAKAVQSKPDLLAEALGIETRIRLDRGEIDEAARFARLQSNQLNPESPTRSKWLAITNRVDVLLAQGRAVRVERFLTSIAKRWQLELEAPELQLQIGITQALLAIQDSEAADDARQILSASLARAGAATPLTTRARIALARLAVREHWSDVAQSQLEILSGLPLFEDPSSDLACDFEALRSQALRGGSLRDPQPAALGGPAHIDASQAAVNQRLQSQFARNLAALDALIERWKTTELDDRGASFLAVRHRRALLSESYELAKLTMSPLAAREFFVEQLLRLQALGTETRLSGVDAVSLTDVREDYLRPGDTLVFMLASQERSHLLLLDRDTIREWRLPSWSAIAGHVRHLEELLARPVEGLDPTQQDALGSELLQASRVVSELVLPDAAREALRKSSVITASADHGVLRSVPLECLTIAPKTLVGQACVVNTLTSIPIGIRVLLPRRERAGSAPSSSDTSPHTSFFVSLATPALPDESATERQLLDAVQAPFWPDAKVAVGWAGTTSTQPASAENLRDLVFGRSLTHLFAHGTPATAPGPKNTCLQLFDGTAVTTITTDDITRMELPAHGTVILSACGAARSKPQLGDERVRNTLGGAFLRTGAHTVVQAQAQILLGPHVELWQETYRELQTATTLSISSALTRARATLARQDGPPSWLEAFQHAQVQVFGAGFLPLRMDASRDTGR